MSDTQRQRIADFDALVRERRSVRGFLDKTVPEDVMRAVFETARWSPSGTNVQPWHICVASGTVRNRLRERFMENVKNDVPIITDHEPDGRLGDPWRERKRGCARALYGAMDIAWEDKAARGDAYFRNYELFDAPHVAFFGMHALFGPQSAADVGMYAQTLMLAMTTHGIASCPQGTMRNYPDLVRETFDLDPDIKILFGISFGYEDPSVPANAARTDRASVAETVQFLG